MCRTRIGRTASTTTPPFKLPHLETLTLDEVGFSTFRPSYAALLDPAALPSLVTLAMHHCDLVWTLFPEPRTFNNVTTFRFTNPGAFPVTHLSQMRFPALEHLTLCPVALRDVLSRASSTASTRAPRPPRRRSPSRASRRSTASPSPRPAPARAPCRSRSPSASSVPQQRRTASR